MDLTTLRTAVRSLVRADPDSATSHAGDMLPVGDMVRLSPEERAAISTLQRQLWIVDGDVERLVPEGSREWYVRPPQEFSH